MRTRAALIVALAISVAAPPANAQADGVLCRGDASYEVCVDTADRIGRFTARTGPDHPARLQNLLYGGRDRLPWSSYTSVRSHSSGTTYAAFSPQEDPSRYGAARLGDDVTVSATHAAIETVHRVRGADRLTVRQTVAAAGDGLEVSTAVTNDGPAAVRIGIRMLFDVAVGSDDGPWMRERAPDGTWRSAEAVFRAPGFGYWEVQDNSSGALESPGYAVLGRVRGPEETGAEAPEELAYACWDSVFVDAFGYEPAGRNVADGGDGCSGRPGGDSALVYWWGRDDGQTLDPGATVTARVVLYAVPVGPLGRGTMCDADGLRAADGTPAEGAASLTIRDLEPRTGPAAPAVHDVNCEVVVPLEDTLDGRTPG